MKPSSHAVVILLFALAAGATSCRGPDQPAEDAKAHRHGQTEPAEKTAPERALEPAAGASVKILSPKDGEIIGGSEVPFRFRLVKGKRGEHVHAYVDGELMGMFKSESGTLNGIQSGRHALEVRVVAADHQTELDATDSVRFMVK